MLPLQALNQAIVCAEETTGLIHHSDHWSQYVSVVYNGEMPSTGLQLLPEVLVTGMTMLWLKTITAPHKNELIHTRRWGDVVEVETATFEWVNWWNDARLHQSLGIPHPG